MTEKHAQDSYTTHTGIDPVAAEGYEDFDIDVVPTIREVEQPDEIPCMDTGLTATDEIDLDALDDMPEMTTLEDCQALSRMVWNLPGMFLGDHLIRSDDQINIFAKEMFVYCSKKGIDPRDYVGDWMPLAMIGGSMAVGMLKDHKAHKKAQSMDALQLSAPAGFDTGKGVTGSGTHNEYVPPENMENLNPASSCGGDETPMEE